MDAAVEAIGADASRKAATIAIYGDYDADGVTACAMLTRCLRAAGATVIPYIPNRMTEGYGLHAAALAELAARGTRLRHHRRLRHEQCRCRAATAPQNMRLVVTDHHLALAPGDSPPQLAPADALVNPKLPGSTYSVRRARRGRRRTSSSSRHSRRAASCRRQRRGVARARRARHDRRHDAAARREPSDRPRRVAANGRASGLRALCEVAGIAPPPRGTDIAFAVGPRINAAGRMEDARLALELCLSDDPEESERLAVLTSTPRTACGSRPSPSRSPRPRNR